jgi:hypothetical protein
MNVFGASFVRIEERRVGDSQIEPAMGTVRVVVLHVGGQDAVEMPPLRP